MADITATRPDFYANLKSLRIRQRAKKAKVSSKEQAYYAMSQSEGFKHFEKEKELLLNDMNELIDSSISSGLSREQIGENTIVVSLAKGVIKRLFNKVYDARDACEKTK